MSKTLKALGIIALVAGTATVVGIVARKLVKKNLDEIEEELFMRAENFNDEILDDATEPAEAAPVESQGTTSVEEQEVAE